MQSVAPEIDERVYAVLKVEASAAARTSFGGTAPARVAAAVKAAKARLLAEEA